VVTLDGPVNRDSNQDCEHCSLKVEDHSVAVIAGAN